MNDVDITLYLNKYRVKALEEALGKRTAETIEDKLSEAFDVLYQGYVDDEQRASIEAKIECEEAAEQARIEAKRRFAVYHVREEGEDYHLQAITFVHQCRQPIVTGFMIETSCQPIHKHLLTLLSKRIQSVSKNSMKPAWISIQINALPHLLSLI